MGASSGKLADKYHVQKVKLGQGSFGVVYRGTNKKTNELVAIKHLDRAALTRKGVKQENLKREISMMRAVDSEFVLHLIDVYQTKPLVYLVLEHCEGGDFGDKLTERATSLQSSIRETEAAAWMRQVLGAVNALHSRGICHRDIKPDNFLVAFTDKGSQLKLADFGHAITVKNNALLTEKCGTPAFMAPEVHSLPSSKGYSLPVDMWATGCIMFMLMTRNRHPFVSNGRLLERCLLRGEVEFSQGLMGDLLLNKFSEESQVLCKKLLEPDARKRVTVDNILSAPWLQPGRCGYGDETWLDGHESESLKASALSSPMHALAAIDGIGEFVGGWWNAITGGQTASEAEMQVREIDQSMVTIQTRIDSLDEESERIRRELKEHQEDVHENKRLKRELELIEHQLSEERLRVAKAKRKCMPMPRLIPQMPKLLTRRASPPLPERRE
jgi:serine/threonine protein kinase